VDTRVCFFCPRPNSSSIGCHQLFGAADIRFVPEMDQSSPESIDETDSATRPLDDSVVDDANGDEPGPGAEDGDVNNSSNYTTTTKPTVPVQKRRRVTRACDECRRKKIKCDGKQPCTHCTVYSYGKINGSPIPSATIHHNRLR
jgi:hypothetical protein